MKNAIRLLSLGFCFTAVRLFAGPIGTSAESAVTTQSNEPTAMFEFDVRDTYVGDGDVERGRFSVRGFDENDASASLIFTPRIRFGILRLGGGYERFDFGLPAGTQLPDRLQAAYFVVGLDTEFSDSFLIRLEARPGWYGADSNAFRGDTFDVPFIIGGTYIFSPTFQLVFGVGVDFHSHYPVLPGGGVRWKFAPHWTLNAVVPTPRLEYEVNKSFTLYGGADIKAGTYRVNSSYGDTHFDRRLNNAYMAFTEVRAGVGFDWKLCPNFTLTAEGGYVPYRNFDFYRPSVRYHQDGGAPYGTLGLHAAF
ncbi:MAG: DUF6268 family outer membrane beta-barrel protein [Chthoniobacterales bacterium]